MAHQSHDMIYQHSDVRGVEKSLKKEWNSETWPNNLANQLQGNKSSRKRESHLGKNEKGTKPVRLRFLVPELFEMPSNEEEASELNRSQTEDDSTFDVSTMLLAASSDDDVVEECEEDSYVGSSGVTLVSTHLCSVPEEVNETQTLVPILDNMKLGNTLYSGNWSGISKTSCSSQPSNRSRFAEELQKIDLPLENKQLQSLSSNRSVPDSMKISDNEKSLLFRQPKQMRDSFVHSDNKNRSVLKELGCCQFVSSLQPKSDGYSTLYTNANKENVCCNFAPKLSSRSCNDIKITPNNSYQKKISRTEKEISAYMMPVGLLLDKSFQSLQHEGDLSRKEGIDLPDKNKLKTCTPVCERCLWNCETEEKGVQCELGQCGNVSRSKFQDKQVQCEFEKADKCVTADLRLKSEEKSERTLVVKGKRYNVLSKLGSGGSSVVYQVLDPSTSSLFAVKCVRLPVDQEATARGYINEINLLQQLQDSDCVITLHDFEHIPEKEILYVVMEKGDTDLSRMIRDSSRRRRNLSVPMIVYYWTEMLNAVKCIHDHSIIHSDLKPANFLLVSGRLKLIDFGIASSVQSDMTSVFKDSVTGTLNYMSPEAVMCCNGSSRNSNKYKVSYRSDVWSLGCILYSLIYGRTPFQHIENMYMKIAAITEPSTQINFPADKRCPQILLETLKQCLAFDPKKRPTISELLAVQYIGDSLWRD